MRPLVVLAGNKVRQLFVFRKVSDAYLVRKMKATDKSVWPGGPEHLLMGNIAGEDRPAPQIHQTDELQHIEGRKTRREKCSHPVEKSIHTKSCVERVTATNLIKFRRQRFSASLFKLTKSCLGCKWGEEHSLLFWILHIQAKEGKHFITIQFNALSKNSLEKQQLTNLLSKSQQQQSLRYRTTKPRMKSISRTLATVKIMSMMDSFSISWKEAEPTKPASIEDSST